MRAAWAITLAATVGALTGILILTNVLAGVSTSFADGVGQTAKLDRTSDTALRAALELPGSNDALVASLPEVLSTAAALTRGRSTLATLGSQLTTLGAVLGRADPHLRSIVSATKKTDTVAAEATVPVGHIVGTLDRSNEQVQDLGTKLDLTLVRARSIEARLQLLLLFPVRTR